MKIVKDIVSQAEQVIMSLQKDNDNNVKLKTSQIRKILNAITTVSNKIERYQAKQLAENNGKMPTELSDELAMEVAYLKVGIVYQVGREKQDRRRDKQDEPVKEFVKKARLIEHIDEIGKDIQKYKEFAKYIEALVAYHKYHGGKDK